jgi:hypothetical protein
MSEENTPATETVETTETTAPTETQGLLGDAQPTESAETTEQTTQYDWLPEKFKTPEDLAKSYNELEKKLADIPKAPKEYSWDFVNNMDMDLTGDEDTKREAEDLFRTLNMSQKQIEGVVALYKDQLGNIDEQYQKQMPVRADLEQENANLKTKWGNEYDTKLAAVKKYASSLPAHVLTMPLTDTADGLEILYNMMDGGKVPNPITNTQSRTEDTISIREKIREMRNDPKMNLPQGDPIGDNARAELYRMYEKLTQLGG